MRLNMLHIAPLIHYESQIALYLQYIIYFLLKAADWKQHFESRSNKTRRLSCGLENQNNVLKEALIFHKAEGIQAESDDNSLWVRYFKQLLYIIIWFTVALKILNMAALSGLHCKF